MLEQVIWALYDWAEAHDSRVHFSIIPADSEDPAEVEVYVDNRIVSRLGFGFPRTGEPDWYFCDEKYEDGRLENVEQLPGLLARLGPIEAGPAEGGQEQ